MAQVIDIDEMISNHIARLQRGWRIANTFFRVKSIGELKEFKVNSYDFVWTYNIKPDEALLKRMKALAAQIILLVEQNVDYRDKKFKKIKSVMDSKLNPWDMWVWHKKQ